MHLQSLKEHPVVDSFEVLDYRHWDHGHYYRMKITLSDGTDLFAREYVDPKERNYSFHWQDQSEIMLLRWDNAPHHEHLPTYPHHCHTSTNIEGHQVVRIEDVLHIISSKIM